MSFSAGLMLPAFAATPVQVGAVEGRVVSARTYDPIPQRQYVGVDERRGCLEAHWEDAGIEGESHRKAALMRLC